MMLRKHKQSGVTLVELVISIVIIGIAMVAVLNAFSVSVTRSGDPLWQNRSIKIAQHYLDEALAKRYEEASPLGQTDPQGVSPNCGNLGTDAGEDSSDRATFDDVDDYDGLNEVPNLLAGGGVSYTGYNVAMTVECAGGEVAAAGAGNINNHVKRITITVTPPGQAPLIFAVYKGNF